MSKKLLLALSVLLITSSAIACDDEINDYPYLYHYRYADNSLNVPGEIKLTPPEEQQGTRIEAKGFCSSTAFTGEYYIPSYVAGVSGWNKFSTCQITDHHDNWLKIQDTWVLKTDLFYYDDPQVDIFSPERERIQKLVKERIQEERNEFN